MKVNLLEAKNKLSSLIRSAQAGEDVVIADRGVPVVRLVPMARPQAAVAGGFDPYQGEPPTGAGDALLAWLRTHPIPPRLQRQGSEIDRAIAEERAAWD